MMYISILCVMMCHDLICITDFLVFDFLYDPLAKLGGLTEKIWAARS